MTKFYILPRTERQKRVFRLSTVPGEAALMASIIGVAVDDYCAGNDAMSNDARWYFSERYSGDAGHLGIETFPDRVHDRAVGIDYE